MTDEMKNEIVTEILTAINCAAKDRLHLSALQEGLTEADQDAILKDVDDWLDGGISAYIERVIIERRP